MFNKIHARKRPRYPLISGEIYAMIKVGVLAESQQVYDFIRGAVAKLV